MAGDACGFSRLPQRDIPEVRASAHFHEPSGAPFRSAINDLIERFDVALRWHEHCYTRGLAAPQCTV